MKWHQLISKEVNNIELKSLKNSNIRIENEMAFYPITEDGHYIGMLGQDDKIIHVPALQIKQHPLEALNIACKWDIDCIPVCHNDLFKGVLTLKNLINIIGQDWSFTTPGSSIFFESPSNNPFSSDLMSSIKSEGIRVLSFSSNYSEEKEKFMNFIRVDSIDPYLAIKTLERHGYKLIDHYPKGTREAEIEENLEHLTHFLNIK